MTAYNQCRQRKDIGVCAQWRVRTVSVTTDGQRRVLRVLDLAHHLRWAMQGSWSEQYARAAASLRTGSVSDVDGVENPCCWRVFARSLIPEQRVMDAQARQAISHQRGHNRLQRYIWADKAVSPVPPVFRKVSYSQTQIHP